MHLRQQTVTGDGTGETSALGLTLSSEDALSSVPSVASGYSPPSVFGYADTNPAIKCRGPWGAWFSSGAHVCNSTLSTTSRW